MPVYEYKCKCGHVFQAMRSMSAGMDGLECPECKGTELVKLLSKTFSPDSSKAMPPSFEAAASKMPSGMGGGCGSGMCGSGMCGM
jgi:putative FmdB family regulatory protein